MHSRTPRLARWRTLGATVLALIAGITDVAYAHRQGDPPSGSRGVTGRTIDTTFTIQRGALVDLSLPVGDIIVTGWGRDEVRVRATSTNGLVTLWISSSSATLRPASERGQGGSLRYEVTVPADVRVLMHATSGTLVARGVRGDVEARSISGRIELVDVSGLADIESVSGGFAGQRLTGGVRADVTSGEVIVVGAEGEILIDAASGTIRLSAARSASVRLETMSGDVHYQGSIEPGGRYEFTTHSGEVRLTLPAATSALLTAETYNGTVASEFAAAPPAIRRSGPQRRLQVRLGDGSARITAETFNGNITIIRGPGRERED